MSAPAPGTHAYQGLKSLNPVFDTQVFFLSLFCSLDQPLKQLQALFLAQSF
jgi:hypothetical protein